MTSITSGGARYQIISQPTNFTKFEAYPERITDLGQSKTNGSSRLTDNKIEVPLDLLDAIIADELKCPICLGLLNNTWTVSTCLHRFCSECFQRSLRELKASHECPSCRAKLASRRSSKPDPSFDEMIDVLTRASGREATEALYRSIDPFSSPTKAVPPSLLSDVEGPVQLKGGLVSPSVNFLNNKKRSRKTWERDTSGADEQDPSFNIEAFRKAYLEKVAEFRKRQLEMKESGIVDQIDHYYYTQSFMNPIVQKNASKSGRSKSRSSSNNVNSASSIEPPEVRVFLALQPFPRWKDELRSLVERQPSNFEMTIRESKLLEQWQCFAKNEAFLPNDLELRCPFIKAPQQMQIGDLKQYLQLKMKLAERCFAGLEILIHFNSKWIVLDDALTMNDIVMLFWDCQSELILSYRIQVVDDSLQPTIDTSSTSVLVEH